MLSAINPVFVIDDDPGVRRSFMRLIRLLGHPVCVYESGDALLADPVAAVPSIILLDLHLPGTWGVPLVAILAKRWPTTPIVVMTGLERAGVREELIAAGASYYLRKPIAKIEIADLLQSARSR